MQEAYHVSGSSLVRAIETADSIANDPRGVVHIWEEPKQHARYIMGCDPSVGITGWRRDLATDGDHKTDNSAVEIFRVDAIRAPILKDGKPEIDPVTKVPKFYYRDLQVAEFFAPIDAVEAARVCNLLGRIYCGDQEDQCELIYEAYPGPGVLTTQELLRLGYMNLWRWETIANSVAEETDQIGWHSNVNTQKILWYRSRRHLLERHAKVQSQWLLAEYANAVIDIEKMRARACFVPSTRVLVPGGWKSISDVPIGSTIVNRFGLGGKVVDRIENHFVGDLVGIRPTGSPDTQWATPQHWIYARPGKGRISERESKWVKAGDLKDGDCLFIPRRRHEPTLLSPEQLWVMGFWLAEGNLIRLKGIPCGVVFNNSNPKLLKKALKIMREWFPRNTCPPRYDGWVYNRPSRGSIQFRRPRGGSKKASGYLSFGNYQAAQLFKNWLGEYSDGKKLAPAFMESSELLPLIAGHFDGDGTQRPNQQRDIALYTDSYNLATQLRRILLDHGVWTTLQTVKRNNPSKESFVLNIKANEAAPIVQYSERMQAVSVRPCVRIDKTLAGYWVPARFTRRAYEGPVFDLSVEGEHSYVVEEFAVHNSYGFHDDLLQAANMCFWAGHKWTYDPERTWEPVTESPSVEPQLAAPVLGEYRSYKDAWAEAIDNW